MSEHELGSMDITDHQNTWKGFTKLVVYSSVATLTVVFILMFVFG